MTDFWASPSGGGSGASAGSPTLIGTWLASVDCAAGNRLWLLDGTYTGATSMIVAISGHSGTPGNYITIQAVNEGNVLLDGQGARIPVRGASVAGTTDYYNIIGINAKNSSSDLYQLQRVDGWLMQRCCGWDAADLNTILFAINYGSNNVIEDCAGWGTARKGLLFFSTVGPNVARRCFFKWSESTQVGPKIAMSLFYNSFLTTLENCITCWDGVTMPASYEILDADGTPRPYPGSPGAACSFGGVVQADQACLMTGQKVDTAYGTFGMDQMNNYPAGTPVNSRWLGCIAYGRAGATFQVPRLVFMSNSNSITAKDMVAIFDPAGDFAAKKTFDLFGGLPVGGPWNLTATNLSSFKGNSAGKNIHAQWTQTNIIEGTSPASFYLPGETLYNTTRGAQIRYRYQDGVLTTNELWPWPMNQRIKDASLASGYDQVDIDADMQNYFGPYPTTPVVETAGVWFTYA